MTEKTYTVHRAMTSGERDYARGDTREMSEADAAPLVKLGALKAAPEHANKATQPNADKGGLPALSSLTKDELIAAAKAEKVTKAEDADGKSIPFAEGTNDRMRVAIEAKRA